MKKYGYICYYIGQHKSETFDEDYWGSGTVIKDYIKTHDISEFKREVLCWCDSLEELNKKENELIGEKFKEKICMNRQSGGDRYVVSDFTKKLLSDSHKGKPSSRKGVCLSEETKEKLSNATKKYFCENPNDVRIFGKGELNPMYGVKGKNHPRYIKRLTLKKKCPICEIEIERQVLPSIADENFYCCKEHQRKYALEQSYLKTRKPKKVVHCMYCGKEFTCMPCKNPKFCSQKCHYNSRSSK